MRDYRKKLRSLVDETEKRLQTMETLCMESFRSAGKELGFAA
jgi:hypothetical protein